MIVRALRIHAGLFFMKRKTKKRRIFVSELSNILVMLTAVTPALTYAENSNENLDQGTFL